MAAPDTMRGAVAPRRAVWGLVNDGYALVAKTPNLTHDEAFELCRVPDIGDPSTYLDSGLAYLHAPKWGHVFARYYTNAERDSAGRASLVYDVVSLSDDDFAAIGNDPFCALPPLAADRRPERFGELPIPTPVGRDEAASTARLTELLGSEAPSAITTLLGALLAGDRVLSVAGTLRPEVVECLVLLLPPTLRPALTFQAPTVDFPKYTPRLTVAERAHALLLEREWTAVLPRDADDPRLADAKATAARLIALGKTGDRLQRAWALGGDAVLGRSSAAGDLGAAVAAILRMDLLHEGLRSGDLKRAVLVAGRAESDEERLRLADALFAHAAPDRVASALADVARGEQRGAWAAIRALAHAVGQRRDGHPEWFAKFFTTLLDGLRNVPRPPDDATTRRVDVTLACAAASLGDLERFLDVADPALPWEVAWHDGTARWVKGRSAVARLFDALAARGATYADTMDGVTAIAGVTSTSTGRARERASAIGLMLVRRTLRERAMLEPPDRLGALVGGLLHIWTSAPASSRSASPTDEVESALRRLFGTGEPPSGAGEPRRLAAELSRVIGDASDGGETELLGWLVAALERAHAGAINEVSARVVALVLDDQRRLTASGELPAHVGHVLLHFAATDAAFVFRPAWVDVVRQVDARARRELLARALGWVARGYAMGRFTIGAFADACVVAGGEGITIDDATVDVLVPHLAAAAGTRASATEIGLLVATIASVATPAAAEKVTDALLGSIGGSVGDRIRMRRLALALQEIERVRDEDRYGEAREALKRVIADRGLAPDEEHALRVFLGVDEGTMIGRLLGKLPSLTPRTGAAVGDRR
jgi:hypothetical protein